jgi:putative Mn2+ efflux pump MntP
MVLRRSSVIESNSGEQLDINIVKLATAVDIGTFIVGVSARIAEAPIVTITSICIGVVAFTASAVAAGVRIRRDIRALHVPNVVVEQLPKQDEQ